MTKAEYQREYQREWARKNPEKVRSAQQRWRERNRVAYATKRREQRALNRAGVDAAKRKWEAANPEKVAMQRIRKRLKDEQRRRSVTLRWHYNITSEQYETILRSQGGVCAICRETGENKRSKRLFVDHDHSTGRLRGLLCHRCNAGLGYFRERPEVMQTACDYLFAWSDDECLADDWHVAAAHNFARMNAQ